MSLSPQDFANAIAQVGNERGSVLVYRHKIIGCQPCGCDNWPLKISSDGSYVVTDWPDREDSIFPPNWWDLSEEEHMDASIDLAAKIAAILDETRAQDKRENSY